MSDDLLKRLETGHDKECAMSYGMHEHCCDCSYPTRQEAAARVRELEAECDSLKLQRDREFHRAETASDNAAQLRNRAEDAEVSVRPLVQMRDEFLAENEALRADLKQERVGRARDREVAIRMDVALRSERDTLRALLKALREEIHCADIGDWNLLDRIDAAIDKEQ